VRNHKGNAATSEIAAWLRQSNERLNVCRFCCIFAAAVWGAAGVALADEGIASYADGKAFYIAIRDEDLVKSPQWKAEAPNPPLSPKAAMASADRLMVALVKGSKLGRWCCVSATLSPARLVDRWFWDVRYEPETPRRESTGIETHLRLIVLMDGRVLSPTVKPFPLGPGRPVKGR
jgi:hypothetical protein